MNAADIDLMLEKANEIAATKKQSKPRKTRVKRAAQPIKPRWYGTGKLKSPDDQVDNKVFLALQRNDWPGLINGMYWRMALEMSEGTPNQQRAFDNCKWIMFTEKNWAKLAETVPRLESWINKHKDRYMMMNEI